MRPLQQLQSSIQAPPQCLQRHSTARCQAFKHDDLGRPALCHRRELLAWGLAAAGLAPAWAASARSAPNTVRGDWTSPGLATPVDESAPKFSKTASGVKVQELGLGKGKEARADSTVEVDFVLRRPNGYFIYSTVQGVSFQPKDVPIGPLDLKLGDGSTIRGLSEALAGMREGGKRRCLIPPSVGYADGRSELAPQMPTFATKRQLLNHSNEPLLFEIQLLKVR